VAPEELAIFDDTVADFFRDPDGTVNPAHRDEAVGFGLDASLATPYVLAVAIPVVQYLVSVVVQTTKEEAGSVVSGWVRRLFRRGDTQPPPPGPALTVEQGKRVRAIAFEKARALGVPDGQAALLADSVSGGLLTAG
jgi:hypothetical protein